MALTVEFLDLNTNRHLKTRHNWTDALPHPRDIIFLGNPTDQSEVCYQVGLLRMWVIPDGGDPLVLVGVNPFYADDSSG